jgi:hypothetical protein
MLPGKPAIYAEPGLLRQSHDLTVPATPPPPARGHQFETNSPYPSVGDAAADPAFRSSLYLGLAPASAARPPMLRDVFTPSRPKDAGPFFVGRKTFLQRLVTAVEDERAHVVLFGDRGRGKTSLTNVFAKLARDNGYRVLRRSCSSAITFEELFRGFLGEIPWRIQDANNFPIRTTAAALLPEGEFDAAQLVAVLQRIREEQYILIIDEFDRVQSERLRNNLVEAIKNASDIGVTFTFLIVGVAGSLEDLLGRHPSIQRNVVGIHLPQMRQGEIRELISAGGLAAGFTFDEGAILTVQYLARGMPYYSHLLALYAGRSAEARGSSEVTAVDVSNAVDDVLLKQEEEVKHHYQAAIGTDPAMEDVLFAAAAADTDAHGQFSIADAAAVGATPDSRLAPALLDARFKSLTTPPHGRALTAHPGAAGARYSFTVPALAHYVLLRQSRRRGLIPTGEPAKPGGHAQVNEPLKPMEAAQDFAGRRPD